MPRISSQNVCITKQFLALFWHQLTLHHLQLATLSVHWIFYCALISFQHLALICRSFWDPCDSICSNKIEDSYTNPTQKESCKSVEKWWRGRFNSSEDRYVHSIAEACVHTHIAQHGSQVHLLLISTYFPQFFTKLDGSFCVRLVFIAATYMCSYRG